MTLDAASTEAKKQQRQVSPEELAKFCAEVADHHKAADIVTLKLTELSVIADYFILCTGNTEPHIKALANYIGRETRNELQIRPKVEGKASSSWIIMDYGNVIIHIMTPQMRELYQLESLWGDAPSSETLEKIENVQRESLQ